MKTTTIILIVILILSGIMPLVGCLFAGFNQPMVMQMFHLTSGSTPDLEKTIVVFGASLTMAAIVQFLAAAWLIKGKQEGFSLSLWVAIMLMVVGLYMGIFFKIHQIHDNSFYPIDFIKGILILALTLVARKK